MESSPLFKLPGELRNRIYELVLYQREEITIRVLTGSPKLRKQCRNGQIFPPPATCTCSTHILALPTTCTQIRHESLPMLFEINRFNFIARHTGQRYKDNSIWQNGLHKWMQQIGDRNRRRLTNIQIDIGTSFMYDFYPTSETVWRSVSSLLPLFDLSLTQVSMKTEVNWMSRSHRAFSVTIPLNSSTAARQAVKEALACEREDMEVWYREMLTPREAGYRRVELETCGQELRSFVSLLDITHLVPVG